jgi:DNA repair photolyase
MIDKPKSNMYDWIDRTHNFIHGECPHLCSYCFVKSSRVKHLYEGKPRLNEKAFRSLGKGHFYFIGSMIDMWANDIPSEWIYKILEQTRKYDNKYLFQSKNPIRFVEFQDDFPKRIVLGTTIESDRQHRCMGIAPDPMERALVMGRLSRCFETIVTIEPVLLFNPMELWNMICICDPKWVNIGADSKGHNLPEPDTNKIISLIWALRGQSIKVKLKSNLKRLITDKDFLKREFPK